MGISEAIQPQVTQPNTDAIRPQGAAGITADIAGHRAGKTVLHNSRLLCGVTMAMGVCSAFIGVCMVLMVFSVLTPLSAISFLRVLAAAQWGLGGAMFCMLCPGLWKWALRAGYRKVTLDERGAEFQLGSKIKPVGLFMEWSNIASVQQKRAGNGFEFTITGKDGSYVSYNSYSFFRPKHVARMIAQRAGLTVQRV
jgi:hypothetical protein